MSSLKAKIVQQLDELPENTLKQVLDYVEFLNWRKTANSGLNSTLVDENSELEDNVAWLETDLSNLGDYEPYEWQPGELDQGLPVQTDPDKGVVIVQE